MALVGLLEDNTRIAKLCATMLHYAGHQVTVYTYARECLDALLPLVSCQEGPTCRCLSLFPPPLPVDVLILDLHLPDIDGVEVVESLCSHPLTQTLPLILCTAANTAEISRVLRVAPQAGFIEKPFTFEQLTSAIHRALAPSLE